MLDPLMRRVIDPPLVAMAASLARTGLTANQITLAGFAIGLLAVPLIAWGHFAGAIVVILLNRVFDGLDGAVARRSGSTTAYGGYIDIVCDMVFYAAVPMGFALRDPANALWVALLLTSFISTGASFLGHAILAAQRGDPDDRARGAKSFFHSAGLMEGTETIIAFVLFCLLPGHFPLLAGIVSALCFWTALARVAGARR